MDLPLRVFAPNLKQYRHIDFFLSLPFFLISLSVQPRQVAAMPVSLATRFRGGPRRGMGGGWRRRALPAASAAGAGEPGDGVAQLCEPHLDHL